MAKETTEKKLYDLLVTRDYDNFQALDSRTGKVPVNPESGTQDVSQADMFVFDWSSSRGKNYGTAVILLTPEHELELYFGDNLGKTMEDPEDKDEWFEFMEQLRHFATRTNFNGFRPLNINQLRHSLQGQAAIREGLFESWQGRKNMSWSAGPTEARLMIRHKRNLDETDARHLYIESLFIETVEGERYKLPFAKLAGGRAMLEHVRQGGRPYDIRGQHIVDIVEELNVLGRFERGVARETVLEGDTAQLVSEAAVYRKTLKENLKRLGTGRGYAEYFESWNPVDLTEQDVVIESLKHMFVKQTLDARIEQALPVLARIQQQGNAMKEANIFEAWANRLVEGTWSTPDTPEAQQKLLEFMSREQPVGADATDATEQLYDLLGDDKLFDQLATLAESDPNADCRQIVLDRMQELSDNPDVRAVLEQLNIDADAAMTPPESLPADLDDQEQGMSESEESWHGITDPELLQDMMADAGSMDYDEFYDEYSNMLDDPEEFWSEYHVAKPKSKKRSNYNGITSAGSKDDYFRNNPDHPSWENPYRKKDTLESLRRAAGLTENVLRDSTGSTFDHILDTFKRDVRDFEESGDLSDALYDALYDYYHDDMPYGVQKARTGDPYEWVSDRFGADLGIGGYGGNSPGIPDSDYGMERESAGDYAPERAAHSVDGGMNNSILYDDSACNMTEAGEHCPTHGVQECWGAMANEDDEKNSSVMPALAGAAAGGAAGYALGSGALNSIGSSVPSAPIAPPVMVEKDMDRMKKLAGINTDDEQLDEFAPLIGAGLVAGARALLPLLSRVGPAIGRMASQGTKAIAPAAGAVAKQGAEIAAKNAVPLGIGAGAYQAITDVADSLVGGVGEVYKDVGSAITAITKAVGDAIDQKTIMELAASAVKYSIPIGILLALLYGGKKLIDKALAESELGTGIGAGLGGTVGGLPGAALGGAAGHYLTKDETDEGWMGQLAGGTAGTLAGAAAGAATPIPFGAAIGGALGGTAGQMIGGKLTDESSPLAGQYGHSGKMKEVGKDTSFLDRLKTLSGMAKS